MSPEEKARLVIEQKLTQSGWVIQDLQQLKLSAAYTVSMTSPKSFAVTVIQPRLLSYTPFATEAHSERTFKFLLVVTGILIDSPAVSDTLLLSILNVAADAENAVI